MESKNINLPFDIETINKTAEDIAMKQIEIEAEKLKLKDLSEAINKIKESVDLFVNIEKNDYIEEWYDSLIKEKQQSANNTDYTGKQYVA